MPHRESEASGLELGRWLAVALILVIGIVLYFVLAPGTEPVVPIGGGDTLP